VNLFRDIIYPLVGATLVTIGAALIYRPLGFLVAGIFLLILAVVRPKSL